jgi:glycine/D-amino acid oxidase-like deaminating enzyme
VDDAPRWESASLWAASLPTATTSDRATALARPWDVIVVGAGVAGLTTAVVLQRAGFEVLVLERHGVGGVTTRGSTGKVTALQGDTLAQIAKHRGDAAAAAYAAASMSGVTGLRALIDDLGIDCSLIEAPDHVFATEAEAAERCHHVFGVAKACGLPVEWLEHTELPFDIAGAVRLDGQAHLDPGALCAGLAAALPDGTVLEHTAVQGIDEQRDGVEVALEDGSRVRAEHVVIATLGPVHDPALLAVRCEARRSYAIAAPHPSPTVGMHISLDERARSIRPAQIDGRPAIVVGGAGHVVAEPGGRSSDDRWDDLERYATGALGSEPAQHRWVAHDLIPSDHVAFIGRVAPGAHRRWVITGFQKWGISTAYLAADLLLAELTQQPRSAAALFDPRRVAPSLTTKLAEDAVRAMRHLVFDRLVDLRPGRRRRPRCTHLGCVLDFDDEEQTWDCPCHGSRYDAAGRVICGPATQPLHDPPRPS